MVVAEPSAKKQKLADAAAAVKEEPVKQEPRVEDSEDEEDEDDTPMSVIAQFQSEDVRR